MRVFKKVKKTGDIIQIYQFEKGFQVGYSKTFGLYKVTTKEGKKEYFRVDEEGEMTQVKMGRQLQGTKTKEESLDIRTRSLNKEKNKIRDIVNSNCYKWFDKYGEIIRPKFLTLTFKENIKDLTYANNQFDLFMQRLNYHIKTKIDKTFIGCQYTTVIEFQDGKSGKIGRGAIHYHILLYNMPIVAWSNILKIWGLGGVYIEGFKDVNTEKLVKLEYDEKTKCFKADGKCVKNIGAYITKTMSYMVKHLEDKRLRGRKCSFCSTKLLKPIVINETKENKKEVETLERLTSANNLTFANEYENEYVGKVSFTEYNIKFNTTREEKTYKNLQKDNTKDNWYKLK